MLQFILPGFHTYILGLVTTPPETWAAHIFCYIITSIGKICPWNEEADIKVRGCKIQNPMQNPTL